MAPIGCVGKPWLWTRGSHEAREMVMVMVMVIVMVVVMVIVMVIVMVVQATHKGVHKVKSRKLVIRRCQVQQQKYSQLVPVTMRLIGIV